MTIFDTVILGIIEGVTEFLPISSTGHMIVASQWLSVDQTNTHKAFEVIIQFAAILAVVGNYREKFTFKHTQLWLKVALAFIPVGAVGFLLYKTIEKWMSSVTVVAVMFIVGGIAFLVVEYFFKEQDHHTRDVEDVTYKQAFWVGIAQVLSLIPGTSRAGASIIGGMLAGMSRKASAEFSFLLALPVIGAASVFDLYKHYHEFQGSNLTTLAIGFVVAFVVAFLVIRWFISFLQRFTFVGFGVYRILFGGLLLWMAWAHLA